MPYLVKRDYLTLIDEENLDVVSYSQAEGLTPDQVISEVEAAAIQEIGSHLAGRYDISKAFIDTLVRAEDTTEGYPKDTFIYDEATKKYYTALTATQPDDPLTDATKYKPGDTRQPLMKRYVVDVALYEMHSRINPRNIPLFRINRRDDAIKWLEKVQNPRNNVNADFLPLRDFGEKRGNDISWNSKPKQTNDY